MKIKKSLEIKEPVLDETITGIEKPQPETPSDDELAEQLNTKETQTFEDKDSFEESDEGSDVAPDAEPEKAAESNEILDALKTIGENIEILSDDISEINQNVAGLDLRMTALEDEPKKRKTKIK